MFPKVNGKDLLEIQSEDLQDIIDNPSFMENEFIDYKDQFSILKYPKEKVKEKKEAINEFKSDVCSFANSQGGYLVYGIKETKGTPNEVTGIEILDKDKFLLGINNYLSDIKPRIPNFKTNFIRISDDRYVFIVFIQHDYYAPYIHITDNVNYQIYKRVSNSKKVIPYLELKNMFNQTKTLEKEVLIFRQEQINYFKANQLEKENSDGRFVLIHIIPESFLDENYRKKAYILYKNNAKINELFKIVLNYDECFPMIEGVHYSNENEEEIRLYDNLIAEYFYPLKCYQSIKSAEPTLAWECHWNQIGLFYSSYINALKEYLEKKRIFICISIVGCKGFRTNEEFITDTVARVDREVCIMNPIIVEDFSDEKQRLLIAKKIRLEYLLSLGIRRTKEMNSLIKEVYGDDYQ